MLVPVVIIDPGNRDRWLSGTLGAARLLNQMSSKTVRGIDSIFKRGDKGYPKHLGN